MTTRHKKPEHLRSPRWLGVEDLRSFGHRSRRNIWVEGSRQYQDF